MRRRGRVAKPAAGRSSTRARTVTIVLVVALVLGAGVMAGYRMIDAVDTLRTAEKDIDVALEFIKDGEVAAARTRLVAAERALSEVSETLHTAPDLSVLGLLPIVSDNLRSVRESLSVATTVVHGGRLILDSASGLESDDGSLEVSLQEGRIPAEDLAAARTQIDHLLVQLTIADGGGSRFLLPITRELRDAVFDQAEIQRHNLDRLRRGLTILDQLLGVGRPTRHLIAVANTAEMRGPGGMILNYGVLTGADGGAEMIEFGRVEELALANPVDPELAGLPEDYVERWAEFDFTRDWRNSTLAADFTVTAPALLAMYRQASAVPADGVIQVDAHALAGILSVVGPVQVAEVGEVNADNVVQLVLNDAYRRFPGVEERSDVLGDVAEATFEALLEGNYSSVRDMADALMDSVDGRHLVMYSDDPTAQSALGFYEADGSLPAAEELDVLHLTVQNMSGNKLDYYVDTAVAVTGERVPGRIGELTVSITVTNNAPVGETEPRYIFGPFDSSHVAGEYRAAVSLYVPTGTSLVESSGDAFRREPVEALEADRPVVGYWVDVPAGQSHVAELTFQLAPPPGDAEYSLTLVPSPRVRPTTAAVDIAVGEGRRVQGDVVLDVGWTLDAAGARSLAGYDHSGTNDGRPG